MREWQLVRVTYDGGAQDEIVARAEEAKRFFDALINKLPVGIKTGAARVERCTGFVAVRAQGKPVLVKHLFVLVDDLSGVSITDWDCGGGTQCER